MKSKGVGVTRCNWRAWNGLQKLGKGLRSDGNKRTSGAHPNYSIDELSQNTEKSLGGLGELQSLKFH